MTCSALRPRTGTCWPSRRHRALAREAAAKSVVLLRNEPVDGAPILPLAVAAGSIGGRARSAGHRRQPRRRRLERRVGPGGGDRGRRPAGGAPRGRGAGRRRRRSRSRAATLAASADVALVVVGYTRLDEGEYIGEFATEATDRPVPRRGRPRAGRAVHRRDRRRAGRSEPPYHVAPASAGRRGLRGGRRPPFAPPPRSTTWP